MDLSVYLAKIVGIWMVVAGVALLRNPSYIKEMAADFFKVKSALYLGGLMAFIIGLLLVTSHNVWVLGWPVIITVIGWASFIKGVLFIVFPDYAEKFSEWYLEKVNVRVFGPIYILLGLFLCWIGYF